MTCNQGRDSITISAEGILEAVTDTRFTRPRELSIVLGPVVFLLFELCSSSFKLQIFSVASLCSGKKLFSYYILSTITRILSLFLLLIPGSKVTHSDVNDLSANSSEMLLSLFLEILNSLKIDKVVKLSADPGFELMKMPVEYFHN